MPQSFASIDQTKMDLGPVRVTYNGVDLGGTLDNATVKIKYDLGEIKSDQTGSTALDHRIVGLKITVETALAEVQDKTKWKVAFPYADLITSGPNKALLFMNKNGLSLYDVANVLVLHPLNKADADLSQDLRFYKATANHESEIVRGPADQIKLKIVWNVYPDAGQSGQPQMFVGDTSVGLIAATAGAAVAGSNTGNGTVGSISVFSGFTKSETITLTCVGVPGSNLANFSVSGSVSGSLGIAVLGTAFVSNQIAFTIADGATDFIIGDSFTIATTAANYV